MNFLLNTNILLAIAIGLGTITYGASQWRRGKDKRKLDDIQTATGTIDLLQKSVATLQTELALTRVELAKEHDEIIRLQEQLKHKDSVIENYLKILQGRNPEQESFMKLLTEYTDEGKKYMKATSEAIVKIQEWTLKIDDALKPKLTS